jgi:hypothetical protein
MPIFIFGDYSKRPSPQAASSAPQPPRTNPQPSRAPARPPRAPSAQPLVPQVYSGELTPRQMEVFRQMLSYQEQNGQPPTQSELSALLGMKSEQGVKAHLTVLEAKGYIISTQRHGTRNKMAVWPEG